MQVATSISREVAIAHLHVIADGEFEDRQSRSLFQERIYHAFS
jgi:hypothetical protein